MLRHYRPTPSDPVNSDHRLAIASDGFTLPFSLRRLNHNWSIHDQHHLWYQFPRVEV